MGEKERFRWEEKLPEEACHPDNDRDPRACRKSPESGDGSGDSESDEFLISGGDREGRSHRDKARAISLVGTGNFDKMGGAVPPSREIIADLGEVGQISGGISAGVGQSEEGILSNLGDSGLEDFDDGNINERIGEEGILEEIDQAVAIRVRVGPGSAGVRDLACREVLSEPGIIINRGRFKGAGGSVDECSRCPTCRECVVGGSFRRDQNEGIAATIR